MSKPKTIKFDDYVETRKKKSPEFVEGFEEGYRDFKIGVMLKNAREKAGMTQDELAQLIHTQKTAISRLENHSSDVKLSTLRRVARALGKRVELKLV